jgi:hypothetical protein
MPSRPLLLTLAALSLGLRVGITEAEAQELSPEEILRCELLLESLAPSDVLNRDQEQCIALLAQLGVQPAAGYYSNPNDDGIENERTDDPSVN